MARPPSGPAHARFDATVLVEKIQDQLPVGSAQNYAALLVLNQLDSYSDEYGILLGSEERISVAAHSLEFLYLAWCHDVGIELNERQLKNWPAQVWKDSANLGINLHTLIKERHDSKSLNHDRLRDIRTLLSFGAVVNYYYKVINAQEGGLEGFKRSYRPFEMDRIKPDTLWLAPVLSPGIEDNPKTGNEPRNNTSDTRWIWPFTWGRDNNQISKRKRPTSPVISDSLAMPGSMPPPPVDVLPLYVTDSMVHFKLDTFKPWSASTSSIPSSDSATILSSDSATIPSSNTDSSIGGFSTQVSALERLEAFLSVLGTPLCEPIKMIPVRKPRLVSLEVAEKSFREQKLKEPVRSPRKTPSVPPATLRQQGPPVLGTGTSTTHSLRWMTAQELREKGDRGGVTDRLEPIKTKQNFKKQRSKAIGATGSSIPKILPMKVKTPQIINIG